MRGVIKWYHCADLSPSVLTTWRPGSPEEVYLGLELSIGLTGDNRADLFQVVVATPQAIQGRPDRRRAKLLVVQNYNWEKVKETLEHWVAECEGADWEKVVNCLRKRFDWEYEDMPQM